MNLSDLARIEILTPRGKPVFFGDLWREQPAVLTFVRHFGCLFCFEQVADVLPLQPMFERAGVRSCVIGNGNPLHAQVFMDESGLDKDVYTDPARLIYRRLAMRHGVLTTINRASTRYARRAYDRGFRQAGVRGDPWQQGGVLVVDRDGTVAFCQRFNVAGERVDVAELERAVQRLTAKG